MAGARRRWWQRKAWRRRSARPRHCGGSSLEAAAVAAATNALPPCPKHHHHLTTYSDSCWGSQIGNAIRDGIQLPLFKFCSMSGAIIFRSGGPITWKAERQERTSLSTCDAEIWATNMGSCLTVNLRNQILHLQSIGYPIDDTDIATPLYNDNKACVQWCHNLTTKGNRHIEHKENATREWVADGSIAVSHGSTKCNPADIFTKEMRNGANFCQLWDFLMSRASTSSKGFSLLSVSRREPSPSMLHKPRTMFPLLARAFLTLCSRFLYPALVKLFLASLLLANISYPVLLKVFPAGSYEQSYGGC